MTQGSGAELVHVEVEGGVATIMMSRPERLNAFTSEMLDQLDAAVTEINAHLEVRGVILTGAGRAFCAGRDTAELPAIKAMEAGRAVPSSGGSESSMFARVEAPIVAAVNGIAVGGGIGFAVQCDWIVAARTARFVDGHIAAGMAPSVATWYMPRKVGPSAALRFFTAPETTASEARALGVVDEVVEPGEERSAARRWLEPMLELDPELVRHTKLLCRSGITQSFGDQMRLVGLLRSMERRRG
jgi:enoyl-CoA hydratase/carnithine racemase